MKASQVKIVRIIGAVDTREYIEEGDRFVALSGTGTARECDRCGRLHEVHVTVETSDGGTMVVGSTCAKQEDAEIIRAIKSAGAAAKTIARNRAKLAALEAERDRLQAIRAGYAPEYPAIVEAERTTASGDSLKVLRFAGHGEKFEVYAHHVRNEADRLEREACLRGCWDRKALAALGYRDFRASFIGSEIHQVARRLAAQEAKLRG